MTIIKNVCELLDTLTERLMKDAIDCCNYQIDLYLYVDDQGNARIEDFINVGGNSWMQDDHYCLHTLREHLGDERFDAYDTIESLAGALEMNPLALINKAWMYNYGGEEDAPGFSEIGFTDVEICIQNDDELSDKLTAAYNSLIRDDLASEYREQAIDIINYFKDSHDDIEIEWPEGGI